MKKNILTLVSMALFLGCSKEPSLTQPSVPKMQLIKGSFSDLPKWESENHTEALDAFKANCKSIKTKEIYNELCRVSLDAKDAKNFFVTYFEPYKITLQGSKEMGLLTGYYEPELRGSLVKKEPYIYPVYKTPSDLVTVELGTIYPELKNYRLRGRVDGDKLVPYYARGDMKSIKSEAICYTDSKIDLFFLEVQGSGRVVLEDKKSIFIGYDNQNGYPYASIGKYLSDIGAIPLEEVSMQSIKAWLDKNPSRVDEVLNHNKSMVFFKQKDRAATGSLGLVLTPRRSVAVDKNFISLGSMLYLSADAQDRSFNQIVMAQDTGGAIKGAIRADLFLGHGKDGEEIAGKLKAALEMWILLPKKPKESL